MRLQERTWRDSLNGIVIQSRIGKPPGRKGYEKLLLPGIDVGLKGWERAHSQGNITGTESPYAIRYAPKEVNQRYQRLGIERYIREFFLEKSNDTELWLTTTTYTHPGTLRLQEITYRLDGVKSNMLKPVPLFEAYIEVEDSQNNPKITAGARERLNKANWDRFLKV